MIRYPGSKAKLVDKIVPHFPDAMRLPLWMDASGWEYREPFFGAGAIGIEILKRLPPRCTAWINDKDRWLVRMWKAIQDTPDELCNKIATFTPTAEAFYEFKAQDGSGDLDPVEAGFRKLAIHQMSFSGLGVMAGGPLGGKGQTNPLYTVDCRWNPEYRMQEVREWHKLLDPRRVRITCGDFTKMFDGRRNAFYYCDPPYVEKGPELYKHSFTDRDHERLAAALKSCPAPWVVSYDDHATVRRLYAGYRVVQVDVRYSIAEESDTRRKNHEILICREAA